MSNTLARYCSFPLLIFLSTVTMAQTDNARVNELIESLQLEGHVEGGFFRQSYKAKEGPALSTEYGERSRMTTIFYLLSSQSPVGHFHLNRSDIVHFFHEGDPLDYYLIYPDGRLETRVMGPDVSEGQLMQMVVPGGVWKASKIAENASLGYALIGEAVSPGFEYEDMTLGYHELLLGLFPQHHDLIIEMSHPELVQAPR